MIFNWFSWTVILSNGKYVLYGNGKQKNSNNFKLFYKCSFLCRACLNGEFMQIYSPMFEFHKTFVRTKMWRYLAVPSILAPLINLLGPLSSLLPHCLKPTFINSFKWKFSWISKIWSSKDQDKYKFLVIIF